MKRLKYKVIIGGLLFVVFAYACSKNFLNKAALGVYSPTSVDNKAGVQGLLIGAYSLLDGQGGAGSGWTSSSDNWTYGGVAADDAYKGSTPSDQGDIQSLETWSANSSNGYPSGKWSAVYDGVQRANEVIRVMRLAKDVTTADTVEFLAEARFLRGHYHFEAKKMWNMVPYVDETVTVIANNYNLTNTTQIWPQIEADFLYAFQNLPATQPQVGRANKYAAEAYLAKTYMFEHKYDQALPLLQDLINNGTTASGLKYALIPFSQNFDAATKNSAESVFACQMSVNDGSAAVANAGSYANSTANGNYGDALNFPYGGGPGACCGFNNPSQDLANAYKTDGNGLPVFNTYNNGPVVNDSSYSGPLDPRIDITIGRAGIPYLDWGNHPGDTWIRDPQQDGHFSPKKTVYAQSQKGTFSDATGAYWAAVELTADNYAFIRYADILLWAAECEVLGSAVDLDAAQGFVNQVRTRAANPIYWVYTDGKFDAGTYTYVGGTKPAANYQISPYPTGTFTAKGAAYAIQAIQTERRLEFAHEGHRFFDLQRWDNGTGTMAATLNAYSAYELSIGITQYSNNGVPFQFTKGKNEYFAIPISQIDLEGKTGGGSYLTQNPGY